MKTFASASFFRVFDLLVAASNPGLKREAWQAGGVGIVHQRHSYSGATHCYVIDVFLLTMPGRRGWGLIVAKETWWNGGHQRPIKISRWSQPNSGSRRDILDWMKEQERALDRRAASRVDPTEATG